MQVGITEESLMFVVDNNSQPKVCFIVFFKDDYIS